MVNLILEDSFGYLFARITSKLQKELLRAFKSNGYNDITVTHWAILRCLWQENGQTQSELADRLDKENANITRMLDAMEKNELVQRRPHENDRRSYRIFLTEKGRALKDGLISIEKDVDEECTKSLSEKEKREFKRLLKIIYEDIS